MNMILLSVFNIPGVFDLFRKISIWIETLTDEIQFYAHLDLLPI